MERVNTNFDFSRIESLLMYMEADHSSSKLNMLKNELNKFFPKAKCEQIIYTNNHDKLFFGMRVYPEINGKDALEIIEGNDPVKFNKYYMELDSKLFDPMLGLDEHEMTAILLHEVGHIVYDTGSVDEVRKAIDTYFASSGDHLDLKASKTYSELLAYGLKDSVVKTASLFSKVGNDEIIADTFVASCGYGPYLESGFRKILRSSVYVNKGVDDRFIVMTWILRLYNNVKLKRLPAIKTLNKAKELTGSTLEKKELDWAVGRLNRLEDNLNENAFDNVRNRFNKKFASFKAKGIRSIKEDIYELNLRLRTAESIEDAMYVIRVANNDISILQDYVTEPELTEEERKSVYDTLDELYTIREKASKESKIRDRYSSYIQVVYPEI